MNAKVQVLTFGCRLNAYESEVMRQRAEADGLSDAVILNTCAVTAEAVRQARQAVRKARRENPEARIIVTGCAVQTETDSFARMPEVDAVIGNAEKTQAGAYKFDTDTPRVRVADIFAVRETAGHLIDGLKDRARAYVEIQNGCDHRCTFCIIPFGRGNSRSAAAGDIVAQVSRLVAEGYAEVVLTGVDLTSWGGDLPGQPRLGDLVLRILKLVPGLRRLRLSSIDAAEIDDALLSAFADEARLAPHLHLSLQHGDDLILKRMKRRHGRAQALHLVEQIRAVRPDIAFGADLIAGFPTETEDAFANSVSLIEAAGLAYVHVFPYSPRPQTPAARMPQLDRPTIKARAAILRAAADAALARHLERQVGRTVEAVVERPGLARAADFTEIAFDGAAEPGALAQIALHGHNARAALGRIAAA